MTDPLNERPDRATDPHRSEEELRRAREDAERLRDRLCDEIRYLQRQVRGQEISAPVVGHSAAMRHALEQAKQVASAESTVLLLGETGTGKERFAAIIHELSSRRQVPMIRVNCAAIPTTLIESELFGREKGAYTGALSRQAGRFELANGSTLFLDEIGELPAEVQVTLLRVLQEKQVERLGSPRPIPVDVRIVAATNKDLEEAVRAGSFREDLYYRLNVFPIRIPPLRERREDIPLLVADLVGELAASLNKRIDTVDKASLDALVGYPWPGNVRELRNVLERAIILSTGPVLRVEIVPTGADRRRLARSARWSVSTSWIFSGRRGGAFEGGTEPRRFSALKATTLEYRMTKLGIARRGPDTT